MDGAAPRRRSGNETFGIQWSFEGKFAVFVGGFRRRRWTERRQWRPGYAMWPRRPSVPAGTAARPSRAGDGRYQDVIRRTRRASRFIPCYAGEWEPQFPSCTRIRRKPTPRALNRNARFGPTATGTPQYAVPVDLLPYVMECFHGGIRLDAVEIAY